MAKYRKKPIVIEAVTFDEFVEYGRNVQGAHIVNGMPWSFSYNGHPITNENDKRYLIPTLEGIMNFTPEDMLITGVNGEIYPCKLDIFEKTYELAEEIPQERWDEAIKNARFMMGEYKQIPTGMFGATTIALAISRYENGERTNELLEELESIK